MNPDRSPISVCFGGGGAFAYGFDMGVVAGLREEGIDVTAAPMIGTSAGSHAVATLAAGLSFEQVATMWSDYVSGTRRKFWVRASELTEPVYGGLESTEVDSAAAVALRLLTLRRVLLDSGSYRLADMVAASSSPAPLVRPHKIGRRRFVDGGLRRVASADLAPPADVQLLIAPFSHRGQGMLGKVGARQARKETRAWQSATGGSVLLIGPSPEMVEIELKGVAAIGDMSIGRRVHALAIPVGRAAAEQLREEHPAVLDRFLAR
ncbi:MAG: patatin-like phospholipase family protein [Acidimicrobiia bacterium]